MNCIAIDDEPLALNIIKEFCNKTTSVKLIGTFTNPLDSIKDFETTDIDLMFLDIQMPNILGFNFLKLFSKPPLVIITTAYPEYSLREFELAAVDYLVKPFSFERFIIAVTRASELNKR
jgi:two-component SAPR family response regulator